MADMSGEEWRAFLRDPPADPRLALCGDGDRPRVSSELLVRVRPTRLVARKHIAD